MLLRLWIVLVLLLGSLSTLSLGSVAWAQGQSVQAQDNNDQKKEDDKNKGKNPPGNPGGGKGNSGGSGGSSNSGNGNSGNSGKGSSGSGNPNPGNPNSGNPNPSQGNSGSRSYYGQITVSASGQVLSGEAQIQSDSPWIKLAVPGMWIEANGTWNGNIFVATEVKLQFPQSWAYYLGPAELVGAKDYEWVSAWLSTNKQNPFIALKNAPDTQNQVRLVAYFDGTRLRAVPPGFPPPPAGLKTGWVELMGTMTPQGLAWNSAKAFP